MRVVITGGCGFLGYRLALRLIERRDVDELVDARGVLDHDVRASPHHVRPYQDCHWPAMPGDRDFLAVLDSSQEFRQRSACLRCRQRNHNNIVR